MPRLNTLLSLALTLVLVHILALAPALHAAQPSSHAGDRGGELQRKPSRSDTELRLPPTALPPAEERSDSSYLRDRSARTTRGRSTQDEDSVSPLVLTKHHPRGHAQESVSSIRRRYTVEELGQVPTNALYTATLSVGTPPQNFSLLLDTGSSTLAIAGPNVPASEVSKYYDPSLSSTSLDKGRAVSAKYATGSWSGRVFEDLVAFSGASPSATVEFAVIDSSASFFNGGSFQGILGLASSLLEVASIEPYFDTLVHRRGVSNVFSLMICDSTAKVDGQLWLGGYNSDYFSGSIQWIPLSEFNWYSVSLVDIKVSSVSLNFSSAVYNNPRTIIDSGTTSLVVPPIVLPSIVAQLSRFVPSAPSGFWSGKVCWNPGSLDAFPSLTLTFDAARGGWNDKDTVDIVVAPKDYLLSCFGQGYQFNIISISSVTGVIVGVNVLQNKVAVYDRVKYRVGIAEARNCDVLDTTKPSQLYDKLQDLCQLEGMPSESCYSSCDECSQSISSAYCRSGSSWIEINGTVVELSVDTGFCWTGNPFSFTSQTVQTSMYGYGAVTVHVSCDSLPQWIQCQVSGGAEIAIAVVVIAVILALLIALIIVCKQCRPRTDSDDSLALLEEEVDSDLLPITRAERQQLLAAAEAARNAALQRNSARPVFQPLVDVIDNVTDDGNVASPLTPDDAFSLSGDDQRI